MSVLGRHGSWRGKRKGRHITEARDHLSHGIGFTPSEFLPQGEVMKFFEDSLKFRTIASDEGRRPEKPHP